MKKDKNISSLAYDTYTSPVGQLFIVFSGKALSGISFQKPSSVPFKKGHASGKFMTQLSAYFQGRSTGFSQEVLFLTGTEFEKKIWMVLTEIPYGETRTYKWVAERVGKPAAARAVGQALSKNPVPIVIPCHRVIESDGSLGGYSSGVDVKKRLLEMEYYAAVQTGRNA